jgi:hypothetical protein
LKEDGFNFKLIPVVIKTAPIDTVLSAVYSESDDMFYVYYVADDLLYNKVYIRNCIDHNCKNYTFDRKITCKNTANYDITTCEGSTILSQFPLPGIVPKKNKKIYFWHQNIPCNEN